MDGLIVSEDLGTAIISFIANVDINDKKADQIASNLSESVIRKRIKLLELVVALKEHLLADEASQRRKALYCLSSVLTKLPEDQLLKNEVSVIFSFYLSKLEDTELSKEAYSGLSSLAKMKYISLDNTKDLVKHLSQNYKPS